MTTLSPVIALSAIAIPALTRSSQAVWARLATHRLATHRLATHRLATHRLATHRRAGGGTERGSVTIEQVLWAVAVIAIVGIVVAAIRAYVNAQVGSIT